MAEKRRFTTQMIARNMLKKFFCFFIFVSNFDNYSNYLMSNAISPSLVKIGLKTKKLDAS